MADFSSTKKDCTKDEFYEQLQCMVELNGYNPNFIPDNWEQWFDDGKEVSDCFYDNYNPDDEDDY